MGNFSRDTFRLTRENKQHYIGVRLQQGVPLVDADWNELEDIRRHEFKDFLRAYVGNGVPIGNNGFAIIARSGVENDFIIVGGDGTLEGAGRCLVGGWDARIDESISYSAQGLDDLTTPAAAREDTVYLDVWEREVDFQEDDILVNTAIGVETAVRIKLEWLVRVAEGSNPPNPLEGHVHYPIARLERIAGQGIIQNSQIVDLRRRDVEVPSRNEILANAADIQQNASDIQNNRDRIAQNEEDLQEHDERIQQNLDRINNNTSEIQRTNLDLTQVAADCFGSPYYQDGDGLPNLEVDLRTVINALMRNYLPVSRPQTLYRSYGGSRELATFLDSEENTWIFRVEVSGETRNISYRMQRANSEDWLEGSLPSDTRAVENLKAVEDTKGDIWLFWTTTSITVGQEVQQSSVWYNRYQKSSDQWGVNSPLTKDNLLETSPSPVVDGSGNLWVFWSSNRGESTEIHFRIYQGGAWGNIQRLSTGSGQNNLYPSAVWNRARGMIFVFWQRTDTVGNSRNNNIWYTEINAETEPGGNEKQLTTDAGSDERPMVVPDPNGFFVFFFSNRAGTNQLWYKRYWNIWRWQASEFQLTQHQSSIDRHKSALVVGSDIYVFLSIFTNTGRWMPSYVRAKNGIWEDLTSIGDLSSTRFAVTKDRNGNPWIFYNSAMTHVKLITRI